MDSCSILHTSFHPFREFVFEAFTLSRRSFSLSFHLFSFFFRWLEDRSALTWRLAGEDLRSRSRFDYRSLWPQYQNMFKLKTLKVESKTISQLTGSSPPIRCRPAPGDWCSRLCIFCPLLLSLLLPSTASLGENTNTNLQDQVFDGYGMLQLILWHF